jgi:hypothetical protein
MGTHLLNVTGRKKIIHAKSGNTEVKIIGENSDGGVKYSIDLKINEKHAFPKDAIITLYPYQKSGGAYEPVNLGTVAKQENIGKEILLPESDVDNLIFRLKVSKSKYILGLADRVTFFEDEEGLSQTGSTSTLLPILTDDISSPYKIKMAPNGPRPPILIVNKKSNIKSKLISDPYTMILVYTAAVREILTNFLIDIRYSDDRWKDEWIKFIHKIQGEPDKEPPKPYFIENSAENDVNQDTLDWLDEAVSSISNLKLKQRENKTLMELVIENAQQISTEGINDEN